MKKLLSLALALLMLASVATVARLGQRKRILVMLP